MRPWVFLGSDVLSSVLGAACEVLAPPEAVFVTNPRSVYDTSKVVTEIAALYSIPIIREPYSDDLSRDMGLPSNCNLLSAGYPRRLPTSSPERVVLNVHPSPLPLGRGPWPYTEAILQGMASYGVSIHAVTDQWDAGPILSQAAFALSPLETLDSLIAKCQISARRLVSNVLPKDWSHLPYFDQSGAVTYWSFVDDSRRTINWNMECSEIQLMSRAFGKIGCVAQIGDTWYLIRDIAVIRLPRAGKIGSVVARTNWEMVVEALDGQVLVRFWSAIDDINCERWRRSSD